MKKDSKLKTGMAKLTVYVKADQIKSIIRESDGDVYYAGPEAKRYGMTIARRPDEHLLVELNEGTVIPYVESIELSAKALEILKKEAKKP